MLNKEQKKVIEEITKSDEFLKSLLTCYKKAKKTAEESAKKSREAHDKAHNFFWYERPEEEVKNRDVWGEWHKESDNLFKISDELGKVDKINQHNKKNNNV